MHQIRVLGAVLLLGLLVSLGAGKPGWAQDGITSLGIRNLADAPEMFSAAVEEGDITRLGSFYDENAILFSPDGSVAQGRNNIARVYARNAQLGDNRMVFKQISMEEEGSRGSIVWLWDLTITPRGQPPVTITGRSLLYLAKTPFGWKILFDMFQLVPQPETEP